MYYDRKQAHVKLTVEELCALALRGGNIDNRYPHRDRSEYASERREIARRLDEVFRAGSASASGRPLSSDATYHAELPLHHVSKCGDVTFSVEGVADGVWYDPAGGCVVEELRVVSGLPELYVRTPRASDLCRLTCYGYFLCAAKGLHAVTLRLVYAAAGKEKDTVFVDSELSAEQLKVAYVSMLASILPRAADLVERETTLRTIARDATFPYTEMRDAQHEMIVECWRDMRAGKTLFAEAPTGIGKTMATLYPAVRCYGEGRCDKIFYLTAKNATRREAARAIELLSSTGTPVRGCVVTARDAMCACEAARAGRASGRRTAAYCNPVSCPFAKGYYDRAETVIEGLLASGKHLFSEADIRAAALAGQVCPHELALDLSERCEIVICDYNYVFSPSVAIQRYFADGVAGTDGHRYIFLVDEAHNLPDRARDMYSAELSLSLVRAVQDATHAMEKQTLAGIFPEEDGGVGNLPDLDDAEGKRSLNLASTWFDDLMGTLSRMSRLCDESLTVGGDGIRRGVFLDRNRPTGLIEAVLALSSRLDRWLRRNLSHPLYTVVDGLAATLRAFRTAGDYYDRHYATFVEVARPADAMPNDEIETGEVTVRLICLDPADILRPLLHKASARVLFSATLTPAEYFADILGGGRDAVTISFDSPFDPDHLAVAVCDQINTRFENREESYRRIVSYLSAVVSAKRGNYMIYFPSYAYLDAVYQRFAKKYPTVKTVVQTPGMTYEQREAFIDAFQPDSKELLVGFCVLGGSFSEGVDLPGRCLIGAMIVGVGIPALSNERNIMREYYDERTDFGGESAGPREGYDYAYTYPGMNHVLQAAGRVIRRDDDRGVVVLMDDRYAAEPYLHLYPAHWSKIVSVSDAVSLYEYLDQFWSETEP